MQRMAGSTGRNATKTLTDLSRHWSYQSQMAEIDCRPSSTATKSSIIFSALSRVLVIPCRLIAHACAPEAGQKITNHDHMPPEHQQASMLRLSGMKAYVREIGPNTERFIDEHFRINKRPDATAKTALKLRALGSVLKTKK